MRRRDKLIHVARYSWHFVKFALATDACIRAGVQQHAKCCMWHSAHQIQAHKRRLYSGLWRRAEVLHETLPAGTDQQIWTRASDSNGQDGRCAEWWGEVTRCDPLFLSFRTAGSNYFVDVLMLMALLNATAISFS